MQWDVGCGMEGGTNGVGIEGKGKVPEGFSKDEAVIGSLRFRQRRKLVLVAHPIKLAAVDNASTHGVAMPCNHTPSAISPQTHTHT